jgi:hypothetical protein
LEKLILVKFREEILKLDNKYKNKLYFYYGIYVGHNVTFDFEKNCVSLSDVVKYNEDELFKSLNLNKIIKFERKESLIDAFKFNVDSVIRTSICFPFYDCCLKLISMRNKLAHEAESLSFKDNDIIENLSIEYLKKYEYPYIEGYSVEDADDIIVALLSNIVYMRKIIEKLQVIEV